MATNYPKCLELMLRLRVPKDNGNRKDRASEGQPEADAVDLWLIRKFRGGFSKVAGGKMGQCIITGSGFPI